MSIINSTSSSNLSVPAPKDKNSSPVATKDELEFEKFWSYLENWVSNPIAFTSAGLAAEQDSPSQELSDSNSDIYNDSQTEVALKNKIKKLTETLSELETTKVENSILKNSIISFKEEFNRHAKNLMAEKASASKTPIINSRLSIIKNSTQSNSKKPISQPSNTSNSSNSSTSVNDALFSAQESISIMELEQKNSKLTQKIQLLQDQIKNQSAIISNYEAKWNKLKESAKKKREKKNENS
ncbi:hypothetical protein AYI70_g4128 [Smittium culicis]|uniref:Uncharacterized protein n=1 Tax=Smittium culicis TaxID=133412 RepID=A0A1R1Y0K3_9FUNG|nr:hypothetical protein AYI70_g4128 [Smittium culicis]